VRLTVIGCSGSLPGPDSPASCYLLEADGFRLLLDLGSGAVGALQRHVSLFDIDAICLSHLHGDHCLDMSPYWVARTYGPGAPYPVIPVYGPEGTGERMAAVQGMTDPPGMRDAFAFETLAPGAREIGPFGVTLARMNHPVQTHGFRFTHQGKSLAYSADTGETPALVQLAQDADVLLCEASFLTEPDLPKDLHLTARQATEHAARANVGQLLLTHLVPWNDQAKTLEEAAAGPYTGDISLAAPGRTLTLS
jgi:ribonuclease BN (tRNA processing enzyme)